jgi:hypothetical protein
LTVDRGRWLTGDGGRETGEDWKDGIGPRAIDEGPWMMADRGRGTGDGKRFERASW